VIRSLFQVLVVPPTFEFQSMNEMSELVLRG
jgi:hypothetical protein